MEEDFAGWDADGGELNAALVRLYLGIYGWSEGKLERVMVEDGGYWPRWRVWGLRGTHAARLWLVLGESVREREIGVDLTLVTGSVEAWI